MYLPNIPDSVYFSMPELSNSRLSEIKREQTGSNPPNPINFRLGSLVDAMLTTPSEVNRLTLTVAGVQYTKEEFAKADAMCKRFRDSIYGKLLEGAITQAVFVEDLHFEMWGKDIPVKCRCKADLWGKAANVGVDLKTTIAPDLPSFIKMIEFLDYDRQAAWYSDVMEVDNFMLLGISKKSNAILPFLIRRGDETFKRGVEKYTYLTQTYIANYAPIDFSELQDNA